MQTHMAVNGLHMLCGCTNRLDTHTSHRMHTLHCTQHTVQCKLYTVHCKMYTLHFTTVRCTVVQCSLRSAVHPASRQSAAASLGLANNLIVQGSLKFRLYSLHISVYSIHSAVCSVYLDCTVYTVQCELGKVHCIFWKVQFIMFKIQCVLYIKHLAFYKV